MRKSVPAKESGNNRADALRYAHPACNVERMKNDDPIYVGPQGRELPLNPALTRQFEERAGAISEDGFSPSAGQVANVLLGWALEQLGPDAIKKLAADMKANESKRE
jgi:hypothetical protein